MRVRLRVISAAGAFATCIAAPALAQDAAPPAAAQTITAPPASSAEEVVGPAQLRDFSLQGTVTRRAETPARPQPRPQPRQDAAASDAPTRTAEAPDPQPERPGRTAARETSNQAPAREVSASVGPAAGLPTPDQTLSFSPATLTPQPVVEPEPTPIDGTATDAAGGFVSHWPWLLALVAALGAAVWYFRRQRPGYALAGAGADASAFELPPPAPRAQPRPAAPKPVAPPPAPRAPAPEEPPLKGAVVSTRLRIAPEAKPQIKPATPSPGIVSARLRPWLDIEFAPLAATFNDQHAVIQFDVTLFNSGSAPARDVLLEARLFNAGDGQDEAIAKYFENPAAQGDRIEVVQPLQRIAFRTSAKVPRAQMRIFEAGGRKVWVPLIGFNASYRWSSGDGQTSASYLLGRNTNGERMAPFRVDLGARTFNDLGAHEHAVRMRR